MRVLRVRCDAPTCGEVLICRGRTAHTRERCPLRRRDFHRAFVTCDSRYAWAERVGSCTCGICGVVICRAAFCGMPCFTSFQNGSGREMGDFGHSIVRPVSDTLNATVQPATDRASARNATSNAVTASSRVTFIFSSPVRGTLEVSNSDYLERRSAARSPLLFGVRLRIPASQPRPFARAMLQASRKLFLPSPTGSV